MTQKPPPRDPPVPDPEQAGAPAPREDELEPVATEDETETETSHDPYDDLWDPDMDTRPERIKRTKARPKVAGRSQGRIPPRGRRREDV